MADGVSVGIRFLGVIRKHQPAAAEDGFWQVEAAGRTLGEVLGQTALPGAGIGYFALVNGRRRLPDYILEDGDRVNVIPLSAGG